MLQLRYGWDGVAAAAYLLVWVPEPLLSLQCQKFLTAVLLRPGSRSLAIAAAQHRGHRRCNVKGLRRSNVDLTQTCPWTAADMRVVLVCMLDDRCGSSCSHVAMPARCLSLFHAQGVAWPTPGCFCCCCCLTQPVVAHVPLCLHDDGCLPFCERF
jgi:hypothetical protein